MEGSKDGVGPIQPRPINEIITNETYREAIERLKIFEKNPSCVHNLGELNRTIVGIGDALSTLIMANGCIDENIDPGFAQEGAPTRVNGMSWRHESSKRGDSSLTAELFMGRVRIHVWTASGTHLVTLPASGIIERTYDDPDGQIPKYITPTYYAFDPQSSRPNERVRSHPSRDPINANVQQAYARELKTVVKHCVAAAKPIADNSGA